MTLIAVKNFLKKFWAPIVALGGFLAYLVVRNKKPSELQAQVRQTADQFADNVDTIRKDENVALSAEAKQHAEKTEMIKQKYNEAKDGLDAATQKHAEQIFEQHKNDPEALAEELARVTGFRVILPKE